MDFHIIFILWIFILLFFEKKIYFIAGLAEMPEAEGLPKRATDFNSWIIGGQYTKSALKMGHLRGSRQYQESDQSSLKTQLEARRERLKQERDRFQAVYKPKVAAALRSKHSGTTDRHQSPERHEKNSPRCVDTSVPLIPVFTSCTKRTYKNVDQRIISTTKMFRVRHEGYV